MKFFASILSVYILLLTATPCVDTLQDNNLLRLGLSSHNTDNNHSDANRCTPFCTCDCCIIPVIQQDSSIQFDCFDYIYREYTDYSVSYISSLFVTIWQPPKLS
jgi:hypothetical protein